MNLWGEGTTTPRGSAGAVPLGSRRALAREFHAPEWNFVWVGRIIESSVAFWNTRESWSHRISQGIYFVVLSEGSCLFRDITKDWQSTVCYGVVRVFFLQVCQCVWEVKRVSEKRNQPHHWNWSFGEFQVLQPAAPPELARAPETPPHRLRGSSSGDLAFGNNSAATPPGAQLLWVNWRKKRNDMKQVSIYIVCLGRIRLPTQAGIVRKGCVCVRR